MSPIEKAKQYIKVAEKGLAGTVASNMPLLPLLRLLVECEEFIQGSVNSAGHTAGCRCDHPDCQRREALLDKLRSES